MLDDTGTLKLAQERFYLLLAASHEARQFGWRAMPVDQEIEPPVRS
jgi:hypothetical protein